MAAYGAVLGRACIFAGVILLLTTRGCIATRSWVQRSAKPIKGQLNETNAKADSAVAGLQILQLERQLVLIHVMGRLSPSGRLP